MRYFGQGRGAASIVADTVWRAEGGPLQEQQKLLRTSASGFTTQERRGITAWLEQMQQPGMIAEIRGPETDPTEALHVAIVSMQERFWLIHKKPDGRVAVWQWPDLADSVVGTIAEAFDVVADAEQLSAVGVGAFLTGPDDVIAAVAAAGIN